MKSTGIEKQRSFSVFPNIHPLTAFVNFKYLFVAECFGLSCNWIRDDGGLLWYKFCRNLTNSLSQISGWEIMFYMGLSVNQCFASVNHNRFMKQTTVFCKEENLKHVYFNYFWISSNRHPGIKIFNWNNYLCVL